MTLMAMYNVFLYDLLCCTRRIFFLFIVRKSMDADFDTGVNFNENVSFVRLLKKWFLETLFS